MAMSHFLAIADLGGALKELAACGIVIIPFHYTLLIMTVPLPPIATRPIKSIRAHLQQVDTSRPEIEKKIQ